MAPELSSLEANDGQTLVQCVGSLETSARAAQSETCAILMRLETRVQRLWARLLELESASAQTLDQELVASFVALVSGVLSCMEYHGRTKNVVLRLVDSRALLANATIAHKELDREMALASLAPDSDDQWQSYWEEDAAAHEAALATLMADQAALKRDMREHKVVTESVAMLKYEAENKRAENRPAIVEIMTKTLFRVLRNSKASVLAIPKWMISPSDVTFTQDEFDSGSYGSVHHGRLHVNQPVVVKCLLMDSERARETFVKETELWSKLDHPNVIKLYGACHLSSPAFWVCELAEFGNFADFFEDGQNSQHFWRLFYEAALGLQFLNSQRIVHGDLKCNNLLVGKDLHTKICDFGFSFIRSQSKSVSKKSQTDAIRWKAPECVLAEVENPLLESDIYSFGTCIYEAVTGNSPWGWDSDEEVEEKIRKGELFTRPADFPDDAWELILKMCTRDYKKRLSIAEVVESLHKLANLP